MTYATPAHPWARYFAKCVDYSLFTPIVTYFFWNHSRFWFDNWHLLPVTLFGNFLWALLEAVLISYTGTTPGKALMGIRIWKEGGADYEKLDLKNSFGRSVYCWFAGMGMGIPVIALFTMYYNYRKLKRNESTSWYLETKAHVIYTPVSTARYIAAFVIFTCSNFLVAKFY